MGHINPESPSYPRELMGFPAINGCSAGGAVPVVPKPHQNNLWEEKELKNQGIKSQQTAFPAITQDMELSLPAQPVPASAPVPGKGILLENKGDFPRC